MTGRDDVYTTVTTLLPTGEYEQIRRSRVPNLNLFAPLNHRPLGTPISIKG